MNTSSTQVQLSSTKVKILSFPREDYWLFSTGILKLLNQSIIQDSADDEDASESGTPSYNSSNSDSDSDSDRENDSERSSLSDWSASSKDNNKNKKGKVTQVPSSSSNLVNSINDLRLVNSRGVLEGAGENEIGAEGDGDDELDGSSLDENFFHIAFTTNECTVIFSERYLSFFEKAIAKGIDELGKDIKLISDSFYLLEIAGDGLNIGKRVVQITEPLYKGDISLFFLSNYFSDIVLVPEFARDKVISILESQHFQFSNSIKSYNAVGHFGGENGTSATTSETGESAGTTDDEKQKEEAEDIFNKYSDIQPKIKSSIKLVLTGARSNYNREIIDKTILALAANPPDEESHNPFPKIFSITKTLQEEVALLLPKNSLKKMGFRHRMLVGSLDELMIPIIIDLIKLPINIKGIVNGVAKRLIRRFDDMEKGQECEMSYLSMARSAIVMIPIENLSNIKDVFIS